MNQGAMKSPDDAHELSCLYCHTTQGFIKWSERGFVEPQEGDPPVSGPLEAGTALAHTCSACHDPKKKAGPKN